MTDPDGAGGSAGPDLGEGLPAATYDDVAGVVDLFGALTRAELGRAFAELAFKRGDAVDEDALTRAVAEAIERYYLVGVDAEAVTGFDPESSADDTTTELLAVGPVAFPSLPPDAEDLPHIMDVDRRSVDREALGERALARFRREAAGAVNEGDADRIGRLLDVSYDLEAWAPVDVAAERERLDDELDRVGEEG